LTKHCQGDLMYTRFCKRAALGIKHDITYAVDHRHLFLPVVYQSVSVHWSNKATISCCPSVSVWRTCVSEKTSLTVSLWTEAEKRWNARHLKRSSFLWQLLMQPTGRDLVTSLQWRRSRC